MMPPMVTIEERSWVFILVTRWCLAFSGFRSDMDRSKRDGQRSLRNCVDDIISAIKLVEVQRTPYTHFCPLLARQSTNGH